MVDHGYLGKQGDLKKKIACQTRSNHNKGELGCVPERFLKRYHET